jgi:microsomal dipeptidase-like Zn-dependent dipeptidase
MRWSAKAGVLGSSALLALASSAGCAKCKPAAYTQPSPTSPAGTGMVDLHAHVFAKAAFSGAWHWGSLQGRQEEALAPCDGSPRTHAGAGGRLFREMVGEIKGITHGDTGWHLGQKCGDATYTGWPRWDTVAHMQYWEGHLKLALDDGLKLMVVHAVDSLAMCQMVAKGVKKPASSDVFPCDWGDSFRSLERQIEMAKEFDKTHDWVEIAYTPADARRILEEAAASGQKKMVWVLGIEADYAWGNARTPIDLKGRLDEYHGLGVRAMYLAHHVNTRLAGAAIFFKPVKAVQWMANCFFQDSNCRGSGGGDPPFHLNVLCLDRCAAKNYGEVCDFQYGLWAKKKDGFASYPGGGVDPVIEDGQPIDKNRLGLTDDGRAIVRQMMDLGVLVDITHLSEKGIAEVAEIARAHKGYPLFASHGYFRERVLPSDAKVKGVKDAFYNKSHEATISTATVKLIADSGGMIGHFMGPDPESEYEGSGVLNDCYGSTKSLAQGLAWGIDQGLSVGFATDFMGLARGLAPRGKGRGQCLEIGSQKKKQTEDTFLPGNEDFDSNGLAHVGLIGAAVRDLEKVGLKAKYLDHVRNDAVENFIRTWEKAEKAR